MACLSQLNEAAPPGLQFVGGAGGLVFGEIETELCTGRFALHGGHVCGFQPRGAEPLLFMSNEAVFQEGKAIRGGIPVCFPWFGSKKDEQNELVAGAPAHGLVRTKTWELATATASDTGVTIGMQTIEDGWRISNRITFGRSLICDFTVENRGSESRECEIALHTYFQIGDVTRVLIDGLGTLPYLDQLTGESHKPENSPSHAPIRFTEETDRIYHGVASEISLSDEASKREILVKSRGSQSTVVWNPWIAKSKRMADFGDDEYKEMCCIETANIRPNQLVIQPNASANIWLEIEQSNQSC